MSIAKRQNDENHKRRRANRGNTNPADWGGADAKVVLRAIEIVARAGGALRFGYTRDGGSYAIGVLGDGDPYTDYIRPTDDLTAYLEGIIDDWGNETATNGAR
jgi:putative hemolysin